MALQPEKLKIEANRSLLSKLLINKGTQALKATLQVKISFRSSNLAAELHDPSKKKKLEELKYKIISKEQWNLLFPLTSSPDIENFDISLLVVLLQNICDLTEPATGWNNLPPHLDTSVSANIARIEYYRNKVHGYTTNDSVDDTEFQSLWEEISKALVCLGIQQTEIDELKEPPLTPDKANYMKMLKARNTKELTEKFKNISLTENKNVERKKEDIKVISNDLTEIKEELVATKADIAELMLQEKTCSDLEKLGKCNFNGLLKKLNEKYFQGTRQWLFDKLNTWFNEKSKDSSNVMVLIAGPGVGKSVFSAEVCRRYSEKKKLAACHFCKYNQSNYRNPQILLESFASTMCDTIPDFKSKLNEELQRNHSKESIADLFLVLMNDPLHSLENHEPMLLVIDALDESQVNGKSELLELIAKEFGQLPKWIKLFITSRPEFPVQNELKEMNPVAIKTIFCHKNNEDDLRKYLKYHLNRCLSENSEFSVSDHDLDLLVKKCEGSFLFAYHAHKELKTVSAELTSENIERLVPVGLSGFYKKEFDRVKTSLQKSFSRNNNNLIDENFKKFLEMLVACRDILPQMFVFECLDFPVDINFEDRCNIIDKISQILPVYDNCFTVYHKSLIDWLKSDGCERHEFTVDSKSTIIGHQLLWRACEKEFHHIKSTNIFENRMNTAMAIYALKNGIYHMIECGENVDFSWAVDVKIVFTILIKITGASTMWVIDNQWQEIVKKRQTFLSKGLLEELSCHRNMVPLYLSFFPPDSYYLQFIANRIDASDEKRLLAKHLLQQGKFVWFEDLRTNCLTENHHSTGSNKSNNFSLDFWRHSAIFIKCCCFSPDGSFLAAFVRTDHVNIVLWKIKDCTIVQNAPTQLKNALGCWWSNGLLWIWDGSDHLIKISTSSEHLVDSTKEKMVNIGFQPKNILTFGDILVYIDHENVVRVLRIAYGEIQCNKRLLGDGIDCKVAVSPDNSFILTVNRTVVTIWKWRKTKNKLSLEVWHTEEIPIASFIEKFSRELTSVKDFRCKCCFTSDGKQAVLVFSFWIDSYDKKMGICVIDAHSTGSVNPIFYTLPDFPIDVFVHKSCFIGINSLCFLTAMDLRSGKTCAQIKTHENDRLPLMIYTHSETGTVAVITNANFNKPSIEIFKVNVPG